MSACYCARITKEILFLPNKSRIFQVFHRAEVAKSGNKEGWGIGLPYVCSVAESHGGSVGVDSGVNRGTTFIIDIPLEDSRAYQDAPALERKSD
nr:ATP-binding protein [Nitrosospira sp. Nsp2]